MDRAATPNAAMLTAMGVNTRNATARLTDSTTPRGTATPTATRPVTHVVSLNARVYQSSWVPKGTALGADSADGLERDPLLLAPPAHDEDVVLSLEGAARPRRTGIGEVVMDMGVDSRAGAAVRRGGRAAGQAPPDRAVRQAQNEEALEGGCGQGQEEPPYDPGDRRTTTPAGDGKSPATAGRPPSHTRPS
ncbi:hypothetical protein SNE510_76310 [Streptomyces sp. NE5-10]|nr:hypothetical protein SNE510_76310 [Streptomyces sp. NE5-10]